MKVVEFASLIALGMLVACGPSQQRAELPSSDRVPDPAEAPVSALTQVVGEGDPARMLVDSERQCRRCHEEIFEEWRPSAHAHASRSNPFYRRAFDRFVVEAGPKRARLCASCHEPALLLTDTFVSPDPLSEAASAGVGCMACHGAVGAHEVGNGAYALSTALAPVPVEGDYATLGAHMARVGGPVLRSVGLCASCHRTALRDLPGFDGHLPGVDEVTSWEESVYRLGGLDGLGERVEAQDCASCHMPFNGKYRGHRFAGGHATLAAAVSDDAQLRAVEDMVRGAIELGVAPAPDDPGALDVVLFNAGVGHDYPGGARDLRDVWLEVRATARDGFEVVSGPGEGLACFRLGDRVLDGNGEVLVRHEVARFRRIEPRSIGPRGAIKVRFRLPASMAVGSLGRVEARLLQRRFGAAFAADACGAKIPGEGVDACVTQPVLVVAETRWMGGLGASARVGALLEYAGAAMVEIPLRAGALSAVPVRSGVASEPGRAPVVEAEGSGPRESVRKGPESVHPEGGHTIREAYGNEVRSVGVPEGLEIEALLGRPASVAVWEAILVALVAAPSPEAIARVLEGVSGWPDGVRRVPVEWLARLDALPREVVGLSRAIQWRFETFEPGVLEGVLGHPAVSGVTHLDLHGSCGVGLVRAVVGSPIAGGLRTLWLGGCGRTDDEVVEMASGLASLTSLRVSDGAVGPRGLRALLGAAFWPGLTHLDLRRNRLGAEGARVLASDTAAVGMETLNLGWNGLGDGGVAALSKAAGLRAVSHLDLGSNGIGPEGARAMASGGLMGRLERLSLWRNPIGDRGVDAILRASTGLRELDISLTGLGPGGLRSLRAGVLPRLEALFAYGNALGASGSAVLASSPGLPALTHLEIGNNGIGDDGLLAFSEASPPVLRELVVWRNGITDRGAAGFAGSGTMARLGHLNLFDNAVGEAGVEALVGAPRGASARVLGLSRNRAGVWLGRALGEAHGASPWGEVILWDGRSRGGVAARVPAWVGLGFEENPLGDGGLAAFLEGARTEEIEVLSVRGQGLSDAALWALVGAPRGWAGLRRVDLGANRLSVEGREALEALRVLAPGLDRVDVSLNLLMGIDVGAAGSVDGAGEAGAE